MDSRAAGGFVVRIAPVVLLLGACTSSTPPRPTTPAQNETEAQAVAAAKQSPVATPEPRPLVPEKQPPPLAPERPAPAPPPKAATSALTAAPPPAQPATSTPNAPPPAAAPRAAPPPATDHYVWAPGYWYWHHGRYVWIDGAWIPRRAGYVYVAPRWAYTTDGWVLIPGGFAAVGTTIVSYPIYFPRDYAYYGPYPHRRPHTHERPRQPVYDDDDRFNPPTTRDRKRVGAGSGGSSARGSSTSGTTSRPGRRIR